MSRFYFFSVLLIVLLFALPAVAGPDTLGEQETPEALLHSTLQRAREAGGYRVDIALDQTITQGEHQQSLGPPGESAHFEIKGSIASPGRARFTILPGRTSFLLAQREAEELLIVEGQVYERAGDRWVEVESDLSLVGIDGDALSLASVAREAAYLAPVDDYRGRLDRVSFNLYADDIIRFILSQRGQLTPHNMWLARLNSPDIHGTGELWIDQAGLPARLVLNLEWVDRQETPHRVRVISTADYIGFGQNFSPGQFDPTLSPETGAPVPGSTHPLQLRPAMWLLAVGPLLALGWLLVHARRKSRRAMTTVTGILIAALLAPTLAPVADAAGLREQADAAETPLPGSEVARMLKETQALANRHRANNPNPANALADMDDQDGDGLPNGYELRLGTSPFNRDTDRDGLDDDQEVNGVPCEWEPVPGQPQTVYIETDPLNPDSNYDGLNDGDEYWRGQCTDSFRYGYPWDDDNDRDGVPDGIDLSPFSASRDQLSKLGGRDQPGSNLTFETLDQDPHEFRTVPYPFYVEIQVRPYNKDSLRWSYKSLTWPLDHEAAIRHDPAAGVLAALFTGKDHISTGEIELVPFLQATLRERDLPSETARSQYGVSISQHEDEGGNPVYEEGEALYDMVLPLVPVERGGQVYAFQAKMLHDRGRNVTLTRHWRDLRLKWAVVGDVLMPDADGDYVASPDGGYGLVVYDEAYQITGLQVSRQGGASMLLAGAIIPSESRIIDLDARVSLLRAGLEAQFLTGRLDLDDVKTRFDTPNSATNDERWGIPQNWEYRVKHDATMNYSHLDEAIATTTMTTTRQLLNELYIENQNLEPTLVLASEQRTSTVNLDDDPTNNYLDITINTCLKPLITSRSLKLQTYRWDPTASPTLSSPEPQQAVEGGKLFSIFLETLPAPVSGAAPAQKPPRGRGSEHFPRQLQAKEGGKLFSIFSPAPHAPTGPGDWVPLSLDEILQNLENRFKETLSPEELNILKMATTAWQIGMTAVQKIGDLDIQDVADALSDPEMVLEFLDENGLIPSQYKDVIDVVLDVFEAGGPLAWLEQQWNKVMGVVDAVGEVLDGSFFDFSGEFSLPNEETLLGWTNTAINVLNFLAMVTGDSFFTQVAQVLTKIIEIYQKIRALWDSIKASFDALKQGVETAISTLAQELGALSRPLSLVGLIIAIGMIWVGLGLTLQMGDFGPTITLTLVMKAIVETVLLVVLFVVATVFPWGTIVAIAIGLIKFIEDLIGFSFDPVSAFLDWLFAVEAVQRTDIHGQPQIGQLKMEALEPGGGLIAGRTFRLKLPGILTMKAVNGGDAGDLNASWAELHLGRFQAANKVPVSVCTRSTDQFQDYKDALQGFIKQEFSAQNYYCVAFTLPREKYWLFSASGAYNAGSPYVDSLNLYRDFLSVGYLDVDPRAAINGKVFLDISYDLWVRYDECSKFGCDEYITDSTTAPAIESIYFDILPGSLKALWEWEELFNADPDGDGLWGYLDPNTQQTVGPDGNLCPALPGPKSWERWDRDSDGLSDKFELETPGFDPCNRDTDGDDLWDGRELVAGTHPNDADTDDDGLTDDEELVVGDLPGTGVTEIKIPWRVALSDLYPGLPDPVAFPNPRQPNLDLDHRDDEKERIKKTSPNAFNPVPVGEPLDLWINQTLTAGGGTHITIHTPPWANDEASALNPVLTVTLPVTFANLAHNAALFPPTSVPAFNNGVLQSSGTPNVYRWALPPFWLGRHLQTTLTGVPEIPTSPVTITVELAYTEGSASQVSTATVPLKVNRGGPTATFVGVEGAVPLSGLEQTTTDAPLPANAPVTIQGYATDPEGVSAVYVCAKTDDTCEDGDWQLASSAVGILSSPAWSYSFNPSSDDVYHVRAYAIDNYQVVGPVSDPITIGVDRTPPADVQFDLESTAYLSTTVGLGALSIISLTGQASDTTGPAYVSGVGAVSILDDDGEQIDTLSPAEPGQPTSPFAYGWAAHSGGQAAGIYSLTVGASDVAGNISPITDTLHVVVDDAPPAVYARPPQVFDGATLTLSGLADDTALLDHRQLNQPYASNRTLADRDTRFDPSSGAGQAFFVGDVTGDLIDDVVLLRPASPAGLPFQAGLFLGRPGGFSDTLTLSQADVLFRGELPVDLFDTGPDAASAGDVNGDGIGDLLLGDPSAASGAGRAYLVLGRRDFGSTFDLLDADWRLSITDTVSFGGSVSAAGDVNGDGLADVLIGAASDGIRESVAWLYLGREEGVAPPIVELHAPVPGAFGPPDLAGLGDSNGDGLSDLLIAPRSADVALVHGRPDDAWPADPIDLGRSADALLSAPGSRQTVAAAGDVNGDGLRDMLIGDPQAEPPRVFLVYGRRPEDAWPSPPEVVDLVDRADASFVENNEPNSRLGTSLTSLGDIDGDRRDDFAFGQPGLAPEVDRTAIVATARSGLARELPVESATYFIPGTDAIQQSGTYLSSGDGNGDHVPDLLIGAVSDNRAFLINGAFDPGVVSGIARVEIGLSGPIASSTLPLTQTLPTSWRTATLAEPNAPLSAWTGQVALAGDGDYRAYARARDQAGNQLGPTYWYLGNVWVNSAPASLSGASAAIDPPTLTDATALALTGTVTHTGTLQHLRVFDGYDWHRIQPVTGTWSLDAAIPRSDLLTLTLRSVTRDAFGATLDVSRTLTVDTLVRDRPQLSTSLALGQWQTDISPTLVISWPALTDASGISGTWAAIDTISNTVPATPAAAGQVTRTLDAPGVYYGHVRVQDGAGNAYTAHAGPFPVNRGQTPSVILPDGYLDFAGGEYPDGTLLNYDPYAALKPATPFDPAHGALWGTWDATHLYLGYPGASWGKDSFLSLYLDTQPGGLTHTLPISQAHALPFAADYAFVVGGPSAAHTLYAVNASAWTAVTPSQSLAVSRLDTEIVLDRSEIQATGAVGLLALAQDGNGVWAVVPGGARPTTTEIISGSIVLKDNLFWPALGDGLKPGDDQNQVIAPVVTIIPARDNTLFSGETTAFTVTVTNPDLAPYVDVPLTVRAYPEMVLTGVDDPTLCISCPVDGSLWTLAANVDAGATQTVTLQAKALGSSVTDVLSISVTAGLADSGLPAFPQAPAHAQYNLDRGLATVKFLKPDTTLYVQPGQVDLGILAGLDTSTIQRCLYRVEANVSGTWDVACPLGDCFKLSGEIDASSSQVWQVRVSGDNGRVSDVISKTLVADSVAPAAQISVTAVLSGALGFIKGTTWDTFPITRAPYKVEISIDGGRFRPAFVSSPPEPRYGSGAGIQAALSGGTAEWHFPLQLYGYDGQTIQVVARATDEAGNVGPGTDPVSIQVDGRGPVITVTQNAELLTGTVSDGSGVAAVEASLDGGAQYRPVALTDGNWSFDIVGWPGGAQQPFAILRARDVWGNVTHQAVILAADLPGSVMIYLPLALR